MLENILKVIIFASAIFSSANLLAYGPSGNYFDYRTKHSNDITQMENYHLQQAQQKLDHAQPAYAWGDLAYLLCYFPNHHVALKQMTALAPQLHKQAEMKKFFNNAFKVFPEDGILYALYAQFLYDNGEQESAKEYLQLALAKDPDLPDEYAKGFRE